LNADTTAAKASVDSELEALKGQLAELQAQMDASAADAEAKEASMMTDAEALSARIAELEALNADTESAKASVDAELEALKGQLADLQGQMDANAAAAETKQAAMAEQAKGLEGQLAALEQQKSGLEAQLAALQGQVGGLQGEVSDAQGLTAEKQAELDALNARSADLEGQLGDLQTGLAAAEKDADEQAAIAANLANKLAALQATEEQAANSAAALKQKIEQELANNGVDDAQVSLRDDNSVVVNLRSEALFGSGRARLSAGGQELMAKVGSSLTGMSNNIAVEGHTDSIPVSGELLAIFPSNWELSVARAANTVNYLQNTAGVDADRLSAAGFGENRPVTSNETREGRALNRRVEIVVKP